MTSIDITHVPAAPRIDRSTLAAALTAALLLAGVLALAAGAPTAPDGSEGPLVWTGNAAISAAYR